MKIKQTLSVKFHLLGFVFLLSAFGVALLQPPEPVSALTTVQCMNTYNSLGYAGATEDDVNQMKADGCESPDGPCLAVAEFTTPVTYTIQCSTELDPGAEPIPHLTKQQCISKYHGELNPSPSRTTRMFENNCTKPKGPCVLLTIPFVVIDCKDAYSPAGLWCKDYTNEAENSACRKGYASGSDACKDLTDKKKTACEHGASGNKDSTPGGSGDCAGVETSIIKCDATNSGDLKDNGVWALLLLAINILTAGIGIAAVGGIVYGAVLYASAGDKAEQVKKAIGIITNVVIGVLAYVAMYGLLQFLIPGGVFS